MIRLCLIVFCVFNFISIDSFGYAKEIVISTFEVDNNIGTLSEKILKEAYRRMGYDFKVVKFSGERSLACANNGDVDGELFRVGGLEKEYKNLIRVPFSILTIEIVIFTKNVIFQVNGWESILPYTVGYRRGIKVVEKNLIKGTVVEPVTTYEQAFLKLDSDRNDIVIGSRTACMETIEKLKLEGIKALEPPLVTTKIYHYLNNKNELIVKPLISVLEQMKKEGLINSNLTAY
jgi:polar amino acid transport system substrate-binding protein